ncbi:hypothetical protein [Streptomyces sp. NPDC056479]|uniref:hypothetical protein n=1 Tax=unclassified Streptomyces TaxID=2593676 RepID=UPI0036C2895A
MVVLLAVVAVVGYMAKAGLPWWVVAAVALLTAGFAAGVSGGPARGARSTTAPAPADQLTISSPDDAPASSPISVHAGATDASGPDGWDVESSTAAERAERRALR